ncbi:MAG: hypothetical protein FJW95_02045 [Actinobacteria bacterium]|nr:hypothetical protein [Actinomycetota bacterium]
MAGPDPLTLAVREFATWCDLVCRLHRFAPTGDAQLWWSARRTPDLVPDAVTLTPDLPVLDVLGRIHDAPGASVIDSFAALDLADQGWTVAAAERWIARPPAEGADPDRTAGFTVVRERFVFTTWARAWGGPEGALPVGLRRASGVAVLGRGRDGAFVDGGIVHRTAIGGAPVAGLWHAFGAWADVAAAAAARHPDAWLVSTASGSGVDTALGAGFADVGPVRVWHRTSTPA